MIIHKDTVRIYNLHLESIHLGSMEYELFKEWDEESLEEQMADLM